MIVTLPIADPVPTEGVPAELAEVTSFSEHSEVSLTQQLVEQVMRQDFPDVAALGIETYVSRLSRMVYTTGFQVFWLDRLPDLPGYTLATMEPPATRIDEGGEMVLHIEYFTGPQAAHRAEQVRRWIPPGKIHSSE